MTIQDLVKALETGDYQTAPSDLVKGSALVVENLDLSGMRHYRGGVDISETCECNFCCLRRAQHAE